MNKSSAQGFSKLLKEIQFHSKYSTLPPTHPEEELPSVSNEELEALERTPFGDDLRTDIRSINLDNNYILREEQLTIAVPFPNNDLTNVNIFGIKGDNSRVLNSSFHFILAKVSIVNFKYSKRDLRPYFYSQSKSVSSVLLMDGNIFMESYRMCTYNELVNSPKDNILDHLELNTESKPFCFRYDFTKSNKAPSSQSLGLAVKFQHGLELMAIKDIELNEEEVNICIKSGPLFSNSSTTKDIQNGLKGILAWKENSFLISFSNKVIDSRVFICFLLRNPSLIENYFPGQNMTERNIEKFGTDVLLLKRVLKPGERTPLIECIQDTRKAIVQPENLSGLKPMTCFYRKKTGSNEIVRLEIPSFMRNRNTEGAVKAINIVLWQFELGGNIPLVLKTAAEQASCTHDSFVLKQQMMASFEEKNLPYLNFINN